MTAAGSSPRLDLTARRPDLRVLALVLAGGEGTRLELLTEDRPKPAMPFAGVYRLVDFPLSNCVHSGISDVWVLQQYEPHSLSEHLANGRPWDLDRTYGGLRMLHPYLRRSGGGGFHTGNADALHDNADVIRDFAPDVVLVLSADHVYKLNYRRLIEAHLEGGAGVTMVTTRVHREEAKRFGVVSTDDDGLVTSFDYKPEDPPTDVVTAEVFAYDARHLLDTLDDLARATDMEEGLEDFGHTLLPRLVDQREAREFRFDGYWRDVGTIDSYWRAHADLLTDEPALDLDDPQWPILTYGHVRGAAFIRPGAVVEQSLISPGATVAGRVIRSVLSPGVTVEEGAEVRDSVLLHDVVVERGATVERAVLDDRSRIGAGAEVGGDGEIAVVAAGVRVGPGARLDPGSRVSRGTSSR